MAHKWGRKLTVEGVDYYFKVSKLHTKIRTEGFSKVLFSSELQTYSNSVTPHDVKLWILKNRFSGQQQANLLLKDEIEQLVKLKERDTDTKYRWELKVKEVEADQDPAERERRLLVGKAFISDLNKTIAETDAKILAKTRQLSGLK